jgi:hypothetical protein
MLTLQTHVVRGDNWIWLGPVSIRGGTGLLHTLPHVSSTGLDPFSFASSLPLLVTREYKGQRESRAGEHFFFEIEQKLFGTMHLKSLHFILNFSAKSESAPCVKFTSNGHGNGGTSWSLCPPCSPTPARAPHGNAPLVDATSR